MYEYLYYEYEYFFMNIFEHNSWEAMRTLLLYHQNIIRVARAATLQFIEIYNNHKWA